MKLKQPDLASSSELLQRKALNHVLWRILRSLEDTHSVSSGFFRSIREVIVVASSSRSGSSLFVELLKLYPALCHFPGEINPFLRLAGLSWPSSQTGSDALGPEHASSYEVSILETLLAADAGCLNGTEAALQEAVDDFPAQLYRRVCLQWPLEDFTCQEVESAANWALSEIERVRGRECDWDADLTQFHVGFLSQLRREHPAIDASYYDLDQFFLPSAMKNRAIRSGPHCPLIIEEPPFILVRPWVRWRPDELSGRALVIKTPANSYRLPFLQALFPFSRLRILHLTRNPAASINGMIDGWRHRGFHSYYVGEDFQIDGFAGPGDSDCGWWKFDLPPGWRYTSGKSLEQVCAFQWSSAHQAILEFARITGADYLQVRFEDVLKNLITCHGIPAMVQEWLDCGEPCCNIRASTPPVMTTQAPRPGRWRDKASILDGVLQNDSIKQLCRELGYEDQREWI